MISGEDEPQQAPLPDLLDKRDRIFHCFSGDSILLYKQSSRIRIGKKTAQIRTGGSPGGCGSLLLPPDTFLITLFRCGIHLVLILCHGIVVLGGSAGFLSLSGIKLLLLKVALQHRDPLCQDGFLHIFHHLAEKHLTVIIRQKAVTAKTSLQDGQPLGILEKDGLHVCGKGIIDR